MMRALLLVACLTSRAVAEDGESIGVFLGRPLISAQTRLREIQRFTSERVVRLPRVATRDEWETQAAAMRTAVLDRVIFRGQAAEWRSLPAQIEWLGELPGGPGYRIRKLRYRAAPDVWIPALLYEPLALATGDDARTQPDASAFGSRVPVHLALNGHERKLGKAVPNKQIRCINLAKRGMLVLSPEWLAMGQLRTDGWDHDRLRQLDLCGTSGVGVFFLAMQRGLDLLLDHEHADRTRVGVSGESGGGWQTILLASLDPRVTFANPVAGYSGLREGIWNFDVGDAEQLPCDLGAIADYTHLTAMMAPRPTLLTYCAQDQCCFVAAHALPELLDAAAPVFRLYGVPGKLAWHVNHDPGTHNFDIDNRQAMYRQLGDHFFPNDRDFDPREIPSDAELKSFDDLTVPLPAVNADFNSLALRLSERLPRDPELPRDRPAAQKWQTRRRQELRDLVRAKTYQVTAQSAGQDRAGDLRAAHLWLKLNDDWTVPAVSLSRQAASRGPALLLADDGRRSARAVAERLLAEGHSVLAFDPLGLGESRVHRLEPPSRYRSEFTIAIDCVGERALGLQASQIAAIARWQRAQTPDQPLTVVADGPRASLAALIAAALEEQAISNLQLLRAHGSLKQILEENWTASDRPEVFCFGLLAAFDIPQLTALVTPRPVTFRDPSARAQRELGTLKSWYATWDQEFDPLR